MTKCFKYMCLFISLFFILNVNVNAKKKSSGDCVYNFNGTLNGVKGTLNVKIHQTTKGKKTYYYYVGEKITDVNSSKWKKEGSGLYGFHISVDKKSDFWKSSSYNYCPKYSYFKNQGNGYGIYFTDNGTLTGYEASTMASASSGKLSSNSVKEAISSADNTIITDTKITKINSCKDLLTKDLIDMLRSIVNLIRVVVPTILTSMGIADFGMAVFAGDEEKMKKSQSKFIRRLIIGAVIFIIPNVLKIILSIAHSVWPVVDATLCGIV